VRVWSLTAFSASRSVAFRRSIVTGASRKAVSKPTLMSEILPIARNTSRLLAPLKNSDSGILTSAGRSSPGAGIVRVRSMSV
jgi:hypothetical protein